MTDLYDSDFYGWTQAQADVIRRRSANEIDWENLLEEVESLGKREQGELKTRLSRLLQHLLEWDRQPERRGPSWYYTIKEQRREIETLLRDNPSLRPKLESVLADAYGVAVIRAARETRLPEQSFPETSPFSAHEALNTDVRLPPS